MKINVNSFRQYLMDEYGRQQVNLIGALQGTFPISQEREKLVKFLVEDRDIVRTQLESLINAYEIFRKIKREEMKRRGNKQ